jgi:hypothetical protein
MKQSNYDKWVEQGKPDKFAGKAPVVVEWWKTDPTKEQRKVVQKWFIQVSIAMFIAGTAAGSCVIWMLFDGGII